MQKSCNYCSEPAQHSVVVVLSSIGISPRFQKCSPTVLFCDACLRELCETESWGTPGLRKAVNSTYTELHQHSGRQPTAEERSHG